MEKRTFHTAKQRSLLDLEKLELRVRERELRARVVQARPSHEFKFSPFAVAAIAGVLSASSAVVTAYLGGVFATETQRQKSNGELQQLAIKNDAELKIQQSKYESDLRAKQVDQQFSIILKATENRTPQDAANNLLFFVQIGILPDPNGKIALMAKKKEVPIITTPAFSQITPRTELHSGQFWKVGEETVAYSVRPSNDGSGRIDLNPDWVQKNIVTVDVPQLVGVEGADSKGQVSMHRDAARALVNAFSEIEKAGFRDDIVLWGGAWVPRLTRGSSIQPSRHAFGLAFNINWKQNTFGAKPRPIGEIGSVLRLVPIFKRHGFAWAGDHERMDASTFYWAALPMRAPTLPSEEASR
jgi:D-alanyl-D-alanine carboxypeptidase